MEGLQAKEELEIWIVFDLLDELYIREPQPSLDDQCIKCHSKGRHWRSKALQKLRHIIDLQLIPRYELSQFDPAIVTRECAAKRQKEIFEREMMEMLTSVHVENSGPLLG